MRYSIWLIASWLTVVHATAYAHTFNFEFTDGVSTTSDDFSLSSPGGTHWNRVGSAFFSSGAYDFGGEGTPNEFGVPAYPYPNGPGENVFRQIEPRKTLQPNNLNVGVSGSTPSLGSVRLSSANILWQGQAVGLLEIIGAQHKRKYDVSVYYEYEPNLPDLSLDSFYVRLGNMGGSLLVSATPKLVFTGGGLFVETTFENVEPGEMHIGPEGVGPLGWGIFAEQGLGSGANISLGLAGIQIREVVPEPSTLALAISAIASLVIRRRSDRIRGALHFRQ